MHRPRRRTPLINLWAGVGSETRNEQGRPGALGTPALTVSGYDPPHAGGHGTHATVRLRHGAWAML